MKRKPGKLVSKMQTVDNLVFAVVSRIQRSTLQVLEILSACAEKEVNVYVAKQQMILDGSMQAKITATVLALAAEIEKRSPDGQKGQRLHIRSARWRFK